MEKPEKRDPIIENMIERDKDELSQYFNSFEDVDSYYDWDHSYRWYDVSWKGKRMIQVQTGTNVEKFIDLMCEYFCDPWDTPPIFLDLTRNKKQLFEFCSLFPEFNEKIVHLDYNLIDS